MNPSPLSLLTAFVTAAFVSLVSAQDAPKPDSDPPDNFTAHAGKDKDNEKSKETKKDGPASQSDFIQTAARKGLSEVQCAQLAVKKSESAAVRDLAAMFVKDHTAANDALKGIADSLKISIPSHLDERMKKKHAELEKLSGRDFDTAFLNSMAISHRKGIALFENGRRVSRDESVVTFIDKTLPTLKMHAEKVKELGGVDEELRPANLNVAPPPVPQPAEVPGPR